MSHVIFHQWHVTILCCSSIPFFPQRSKQHVIFKFVMPMAQSIKFTFHACFPSFPGSSNPNYLPEWDPWKHNMKKTLIFTHKKYKFPNFHPKKRSISQFPAQFPLQFSLQPSRLTFLPGPWENRLQVVVRIGHAQRKDMGPQATMRVHLRITWGYYKVPQFVGGKYRGGYKFIPTNMKFMVDWLITLYL